MAGSGALGNVPVAGRVRHVLQRLIQPSEPPRKSARSDPGALFVSRHCSRALRAGMAGLGEELPDCHKQDRTFTRHPGLDPGSRSLLHEAIDREPRGDWIYLRELLARSLVALRKTGPRIKSGVTCFIDTHHLWSGMSAMRRNPPAPSFQPRIARFLQPR